MHFQFRGMGNSFFFLVLSWNVVASSALLGNRLHRDRPLSNSAVASWRAEAGKTLGNESHYADSMWSRLSTGKQPVKIAFVFMIYGDVAFARLWESFFEAEPKDAYTVLVHASEPNKAELQLPEFFKSRLIQGLPRGKWCHFARLQLALIRHAFSDEKVSHLVWISGDSVPVRRPESIQTMLRSSHSSSYFCVDHETRARAEMWNLLSRPHALTLARNEDSLFKLFEGQRGCEDEHMFYQPLKLLDVPEEDLVDRCIMWTAWAKKDNPGFFREGSTFLDSEFLDTPGSRGRFGGGTAHPATFSIAPHEGVCRLLDASSEYLFARKFTEDCEVRDTIGFQMHGGSNRLKLSELLAQSLNLTATKTPALKNSHSLKCSSEQSEDESF